MKTPDSAQTERPAGFWQQIRRRFIGPTPAEYRRKIEQLDREIELERASAQDHIADLEIDKEMLEKRVKELEVERAVAWPKPARRLNERQVLGNFNVPMDHPLWTALHQELDDAISDLCDQVSSAPSRATGREFDEANRLHVAGGIEHLRLFQRRILDLQHRANHADPEAEQ